jgi:hypothetical protein
MGADGGLVHLIRGKRERPPPLIAHEQRGRGHRQDGSHVLQLPRLLQYLGALSAEPQSLDTAVYAFTVEDRGFLF